jgi:hypothetical protein
MLPALITYCTFVLNFSNTHALKCSQISQATRIIGELRPFHKSFGTAELAFFHHPEKRVSAPPGTKLKRPKVLKNHDPDLASENTSSQQMVNRLLGLITERTSLQVARSAIQHRL